MEAAFYTAAVIAILATGLMLTRLNAVHALLYLIVSLLAMAVIFYVLAAPFAAALEVIVYAGAIVVLFVFVVMMMNLGERDEESERRLLRPGMWLLPAVLAAALIAELLWLLTRPGAAGSPAAALNQAGPKQVGMALYGPYLIGVELASLLLLAGLIGAYHLAARGTARRTAKAPERGQMEHV